MAFQVLARENDGGVELRAGRLRGDLLISMLNAEHVSSGASPEVQLLLKCSRRVVDAETVESLRRLVESGIDWDLVATLAYRHGVEGLVYRNLLSLCSDLLPTEVAARLRARTLVNAQQTLNQTRALLSILEQLKARGISATPYKGPILGATAYGDLSLRQSCDLDIVVRRADVVRAVETLTSAGYRLEPTRASMAEVARLLSSKKDFRLVSEDGRIVVELHWRLMGKHFYFPYEVESLWEHLVPVEVSGKKVLNIPPADSLVILSAHGLKHLWLRLLWIADISELIRNNPNLDWDATLRLAEKHRARRILLLGLYLAHRLLEAPVPAEVFALIAADKRVQTFGDRLSELITRSDDPAFHDDEQYPYESYPAFISMRESMRDKVRLGWRYFLGFLHVAFTPNKLDRELMPLPSSLSFLYHLLRPVRLIKQYRFGSSDRSAKTLNDKPLH
jgi:hypothetical protein